MPIIIAKKSVLCEKFQELTFTQTIIITRLAPLQVHYYSEALPSQQGYWIEFHAEPPQGTASKGLAQGSYVAARAEFETATLRKKGVKPTNDPLRPTHIHPS